MDGRGIRKPRRPGALDAAMPGIVCIGLAALLAWGELPAAATPPDLLDWYSMIYPLLSTARQVAIVGLTSASAVYLYRWIRVVRRLN